MKKQILLLMFTVGLVSLVNAQGPFDIVSDVVHGAGRVARDAVDVAGNVATDVVEGTVDVADDVTAGVLPGRRYYRPVYAYERRFPRGRLLIEDGGTIEFPRRARRVLVPDDNGDYYIQENYYVTGSSDPRPVAFVRGTRVRGKGIGGDRATAVFRR